jgi:hypothetical protein
MIALLRKELRQVVPAHALAAVAVCLLALWGFEPRDLLLPGWEMDPLYLIWALVAIVEGLLIGFVQHGRERRQGTEPYLVHRATGRLRPFGAKVVAGLAALGLVVAVPPLAYGLWHVVLSPSVENPLTERIGHFVVAGSCCLPAYAIGTLCAQLRKGWGARALFAVLGGCTLLFVTAVAAQPPAGAERTPLVPFAALQALLAAMLLVVAWSLHRAGDDETRPWPGRLAVLAALASLALFWLPWTFGVATLQQRARAQVFDPYPQVVEDEQARLYLVRELTPKPDGRGRAPAWVREFEFRDAAGNRVEDERTLEYSGFGFDHDPFLTLFDPVTTPLAWDHPWNDVEQGRGRVGPFGFDGRWIHLGLVAGWPWSSWFRPLDGSVHAISPPSPGRGLAPHEILGKPQGRGAFSRHTVFVFGIRPELGHWGGSPTVLVDLEDLGVWEMLAAEERPELRPLTLPGGDTLVGIERLQPLFRMRVGLYEPFGVSDRVLLVGEHGRYLRVDDGQVSSWRRADGDEGVAFAGIPESEADEVIRWRLEPSRIDGFGFHLEVVDVKTGEVALAHDYRPETTNQRSWAAIAWLSSIARPPVGSLWSYLGASYEPRDVSRMTTHDAFRDPLLLGGANPLLLVSSVAVGLLLAWSAHRRLGRDPRERAVRWTWTVAVFALGLPAWFLCKILEPSRRGLRSSTDPLPAPVAPRIRTERDATRSEPIPAH